MQNKWHQHILGTQYEITIKSSTPFNNDSRDVLCVKMTHLETQNNKNYKVSIIFNKIIIIQFMMP